MGKIERESNYEIMKHRMEKEFLRYDIMPKVKLWNLQMDERYLYLRFAEDEYRIGLATGVVEVLTHGAVLLVNKVADNHSTMPVYEPADYNAAMTIYDLLCYGKDDAHPAKVYVPMQSLSTVYTRDTYAGKGMFHEATEYFAAHIEEFHRACKALNGIPRSKGDAAYQLPVFEGLDLVLELWEADEDFPAQLTVLTDQNTLSYMHYETMWFMVGHVVKKVKSNMEKDED